VWRGISWGVGKRKDRIEETKGNDGECESGGEERQAVYLDSRQDISAEQLANAYISILGLLFVAPIPHRR
jgi:hypothetical protein